jgi:hypothetical protein
MNKNDKIENFDDDMLPEYDFSDGVRGKYALRLADYALEKRNACYRGEIKSKALLEIIKELNEIDNKD